ncbi:hypothetical protein D9757_002098 [Collybiopsis confluens]|uniref:Retrotransposon gag domain-containing protein n=1 Tax=Collybiopsis confluens TaxID=2823264 RepID=A0A8H5MFI3_9AGAR|nr:hypothetical protein D9757_002098 [Collybiopsis confluens]
MSTPRSPLAAKAINPPPFPPQQTRSDAAPKPSSTLISKTSSSPISSLSPSPQSPVPVNDGDASSQLKDGWKLAKSFLDSELSFVEVETQMKLLFREVYSNDIWHRIQYINDLDPDELQSQQMSLAQELDSRIQNFRNRDTMLPAISLSSAVAPAHDAVESGEQAKRFSAATATAFDAKELKTVSSPHFASLAEDTAKAEESGDDRFLLFQIYRENEAFMKIHNNIVFKCIEQQVIRSVYRTLHSGFIYIVVRSMFPRNTMPASYLQTVPGLVYVSSPKVSFPNSNALSRASKKVKKPYCPTWKASDLSMPIHQLVDDVRIMTSLSNFADGRQQQQLELGSWVIPRKGRYRGDVGLVVDDNHEVIDNAEISLVMFIPRLKFPNSPFKRPPKGHLFVDFRTPPSQWKHFESQSIVQASCPRANCSNPLICDHELLLQKRYKIFGQVIRGGFELAALPNAELSLALRMPGGALSAFEDLPMLDNVRALLHPRLPPPHSWCFEEGEQVAFTTRFRTAGTRLGVSDLSNSDITHGLEGTIVKLTFRRLVFEESVRYHNLIKSKSTIDSGQSVQLSGSIESLTEIKHSYLGKSGLTTISAEKLNMAHCGGIAILRHQHPVLGESVDVWLEELELLLTLDPNSLLNDVDDTVYSRNLNPGATRRVFDDQKQYHPSEYFQLGCLQPPGRLPWFGVRVSVFDGDISTNPDGQVGYGEVWDVQPHPTDANSFLVLVGMISKDGTCPASWFPYHNVRRLDNNGPLHKVSTFTGCLPWIGLPVKIICGLFKDWGVAIVVDVVADSENKSGISLLIEFSLEYVVGSQTRVHVDYDIVCRAEDHHFIHDTKWPNLPTNSYFQFKIGYAPEYLDHELELFRRPAPTLVLKSDSSIPALPERPLPPYFRFGDIWWKHEFPQDYWLLNCRLATALGTTCEIYLWAPQLSKDFRISFYETARGLDLGYVENHKGGRKTTESLDPRILTREPKSALLKGGVTANGLYLICRGEHTRKLARCVQYIPAHPPDQDNNIRVLQVVRCIWLKGKLLSHQESIVEEESLIRLKRGSLLLVDETDSTKAKANNLLATICLKNDGFAVGYTLVVPAELLTITPSYSAHVSDSEESEFDCTESSHAWDTVDKTYVHRRRADKPSDWFDCYNQLCPNATKSQSIQTEHRTGKTRRLLIPISQIESFNQNPSTPSLPTTAPPPRFGRTSTPSSSRASPALIAPILRCPVDTDIVISAVGQVLIPTRAESVPEPLELEPHADTSQSELTPPPNPPIQPNPAMATGQDVLNALNNLAINQAALQQVVIDLVTNMNSNKGISKPHNYNGIGSKDARRFLAAFEVWAQGIPNLRALTGNEPVKSAISFLEGDAATWATPIAENISAHTSNRNVPLTYPNWADFRAAFTARFETADPVTDAKKHGKNSVAAYTATFKQYSERTGYSDTDLRDKFYDHLTDRVKDGLVHSQANTSLLANLITKATRIDNRINEQFRQKTPFKAVTPAAHSFQPINAPFIAHRDPNAMDVDATRTVTGKSSDDYQRFMTGRCYGCGSKNHRKADGHHERDV